MNENVLAMTEPISARFGPVPATSVMFDAEVPAGSVLFRPFLPNDSRHLQNKTGHHPILYEGPEQDS